MHRKLIAFLPAATLIFCAAESAPAAGKGDAPKAKVSLIASIDTVAPGVPFDVGVRFEIEPGWHIYWQNSGDAGYAPKIEWRPPEGFTAGDIQYPIPKRAVAAGDIVTNILGGEPVLISQITPPSKIYTKTVEIRAKVKYLVCNVPCIEEEAEPSIQLKVAADGSTPPPSANQAFDRVRRFMPKSSSKNLTVGTPSAPMSLTPGSKFELLLPLEVAPGQHIQSNKPTLPTAFPTDTFTYRTSGIRLEPPVYPPPHHRHDPTLGDVAEYQGRFTVKIPGEVDGAKEPGPGKLGGIIAFQSCTTDGHCFPPEAISFSIPIVVVDHAKTDAGGPAKGSVGTTTSAAAPGAGRRSSSIDGTTQRSPSDIAYWLLLAFVGGLILNIMPCVLPVISIKVLSFVQQAGEEPGRIFRLGLTFCAGIILSFEALALIIIILKSAGHALGWGFQFQSPAFVIVMMSIMFVFALSLLGVFIITLPGKAVTQLSAAEEHEGYLGAFLKGALGTILATPCTAPFLGPALGVAFQSSNLQLLAIFTAVGLGMATPFLLLTAFPKWLRFLPRPGSWMERFKQFMGFLLLGTVVYLMLTLGDQIGVKGLTRTTLFLVFLALACWLLGMQTPLTPVARRLLAWAASIAIVCFGWWVSFSRTDTLQSLMAEVRASKVCPCPDEVPHLVSTDWEKGIPWQPWSKGRAAMLAEQGHTVYVDYTATWCATCLANKAATLESADVRRKMRDNCVVPLKADFTLNDPDILEELESFGRSGVPLNVIYPAGHADAAVTLPEQLVGRTALVLESLDAAGPSRICQKDARTALGDSSATSNQ